MPGLITTPASSSYTYHLLLLCVSLTRTLSLGLGSTQLTQDDLLIPRSLITCEKTLLSNKAAFTGFRIRMWRYILISPTSSGK